MNDQIDDVRDKRIRLDPEMRKRIVQWYDTAQKVRVEATTEPKRKQELERALKGAIEGVTRLPPELIIIDIDGR